jgi:hypothetical protein
MPHNCYSEDKAAIVHLRYITFLQHIEFKETLLQLAKLVLEISQLGLIIIASDQDDLLVKCSSVGSGAASGTSASTVGGIASCLNGFLEDISMSACRT